MSPRAHLIDVFQHDDAGLHRNTKQREKADAGRHTEIGVRDNSANTPPMGATTTLIMISEAHLNEWNMVYRMKKMSRIVSGTMMTSRACARFFALILAFPIDVITTRQLDLLRSLF